LDYILVYDVHESFAFAVVDAFDWRIGIFENEGLLAKLLEFRVEWKSLWEYSDELLECGMNVLEGLLERL
jgi:hypothetical protein